MDTDKRFMDQCDELLAPIARAVPDRAVDLLIYTPDEVTQIAHRRFIQKALCEGKIIDEREQESA